jgi:dolichol-phosphate mannosyltransferase
MNKFTDLNIVNGAADFRLLDREVVNAICSIRENDLFLRGAISWIGFNQFGIEYMPEERFWGTTKYTVGKMIKFAFSGITSFSVKPLQLSTLVGSLLAFVSFVYGIYAIIAKLTTDSTISGWTSVLTVILFLGGIQLIMIGILGEYIGRLFIESKKRPNYIVREKKV